MKFFYKLPAMFIVAAFMMIGCSDENDVTPDKDDEEVVNEEENEEPPLPLPNPTLSFGTASDSTALGFTVFGNPEVNGNNYTFNTVDGDNGCGQAGGDYIQLDTLDAMWQNGFSVAAWVSFKEKRYFERIIDFGNDRGENGGMNVTFARLGSTSDLALTSWADSDSLVNREKGRLIAEDVIKNGESMLYVGTISPNGTMKIYVNGQLKAEKTDGHPVANVKRAENFIGHSHWCSYDLDFKGTMSGMYLFDRVISADDVKALYQQTGPN